MGCCKSWKLIKIPSLKKLDGENLKRAAKKAQLILLILFFAVFQKTQGSIAKI